MLTGAAFHKWPDTGLPGMLGMLGVANSCNTKVAFSPETYTGLMLTLKEEFQWGLSVIC